MDIEDCYLGKVIKHNYTDKFLGVEEGDKGIIEEINRKDNYIVVRGQQFDPSNFSSFNEFKYGDYIKLKNNAETSNNSFQKGSVGRVLEYPMKHATTDLIKLTIGGKLLITTPSDVLPRKKKNKLKPRDKFMAVNKIKYEVIYCEYDEKNDCQTYFCKSLKNGEIKLIDEYGVEKIIYK